MTGILLIAFALLPLVITAILIVSGRPVYESLKLLVIMIPLQAFGVIEAGFTITPAYVLLFLILLGIVLRGESVSLQATGSRAIVLYSIIAILSTVISLMQGDVVSGFISENMRYRAGAMRSLLQYALLIFHFALFYIIVSYVRDEGKTLSLLKIHLYVGFSLFCLGILQMSAFVLDLPMKDFTWSIQLIDNSSTFEYGATRYYDTGVANFSTRTTFMESLHFANYLNSVLPIGLALWMSPSHAGKEKFGFIAKPLFAITGLIAMFFTFSRSGWSALALSVVILLLWLSPRATLVRLSIGTVSLIAVTFIMKQIGFFSSAIGSFWDTVAGRFQFEKIIFDPRAEYFLVLFDSVSTHPWLGLGAGKFAIAGAAATGSDQLHSSHGILWSALADYGIIGFCLLLIVLLGILFQLGQTIKKLPKHSPESVIGIGIFASLSALYFQSLFVGDRIQFYLIFLLAISAVLIRLYRHKIESNEINTSGNAIIETQ